MPSWQKERPECASVRGQPLAAVEAVAGVGRAALSTAAAGDLWFIGAGGERRCRLVGRVKRSRSQGLQDGERLGAGALHGDASVLQDTGGDAPALAHQTQQEVLGAN